MAVATYPCTATRPNFTICYSSRFQQQKSKTNFLIPYYRWSRTFYDSSVIGGSSHTTLFREAKLIIRKTLITRKHIPVADEGESNVKQTNNRESYFLFMWTDALRCSAEQRYLLKKFPYRNKVKLYYIWQGSIQCDLSAAFTLLKKKKIHLFLGIKKRAWQPMTDPNRNYTRVQTGVTIYFPFCTNMVVVFFRI